MSRLAEQLRQFRQQAGWRLSDLAEQTGYSESYLSEVERGKRASLDTTLAIINRILDCYGMEVVIEVRARGSSTAQEGSE